MSYLVMGLYDGGIASAIGEAINECGHEVIGTDRTLDVRSYEIVQKAIAQIIQVQEDSGDPIQGLVYCAGVNDLQWIGSMTKEDMESAANLFAVNSLGFLNVINALKAHVPQPLRDNPFSVVAISSDAATRPLRTSAAYCGSKAALDAIVRVSARELGRFNFRVNAVSPGMVAETGMSNQMDEVIPKLRGWSVAEMLSYERSQEVIPGRVRPDEVAEVVFNVLQGPLHLNGAIIPVNGGR